MDTVAKKLYEGLFLIDSAEAASDWNGINEVITKVLEKHESEIVSNRKWDDRRLAYEITRKSRGTYILIYFNTRPTNIDGIERDLRLSERLMRTMIVRCDKMSKEDIERLTPLERGESGSPAERAQEERREERSRDDRRDYRDDRRDDRRGDGRREDRREVSEQA